MTTNLGQLLADLKVLDEAASLAPLNRPQHFQLQQAAARLSTALPELWQEAKVKKPKPEDGNPKPEGGPAAT